MIEEKNLFEIAKILKPHGVKGEVTVLFKKPEFADIDNSYYFLFLDGMYVPFFIEEFQFNSDITARVKFQGFDTIEQAANYSNTSIFIPEELVEELEQEELYDSEWDQFVGYSVFDENLSFVGKIHKVDTSTLNALFIIENGDDEVLIPATPDFIIKIDDKQKQLYLQLPEGLLDNSFED